MPIVSTPTACLSSGSCRRSAGGLVQAEVPQHAQVRAHLVLAAPHLLVLTSAQIRIACNAGMRFVGFHEET